MSPPSQEKWAVGSQPPVLPCHFMGFCCWPPCGCVWFPGPVLAPQDSPCWALLSCGGTAVCPDGLPLACCIPRTLWVIKKKKQGKMSILPSQAHCSITSLSFTGINHYTKPFVFWNNLGIRHLQNRKDTYQTARRQRRKWDRRHGMAWDGMVERPWGRRRTSLSFLMHL